LSRQQVQQAFSPAFLEQKKPRRARQVIAE
jgi:hypothetical protein